MSDSLQFHGLLQARTLEWGAIPFSRGSYQPLDQTQISRIAGSFFYHLSHLPPKLCVSENWNEAIFLVYTPFACK